MDQTERTFTSLKAVTPTEQRILDYLKQNASDVLTEKINAGAKTLAGALKYAKDQAQKLNHKDGCVCVADDVVFGWIMHYFEEDSILEKAKPAVKVPAGVSVKTGNDAKPAPSIQRSAPPKTSIFEAIFGGTKA